LCYENFCGKKVGKLDFLTAEILCGDFCPFLNFMENFCKKMSEKEEISTVCRIHKLYLGTLNLKTEGSGRFG
jgi:hypothetical protein